jgi:F-type H+-transporting ATPase subunit delta
VADNNTVARPYAQAAFEVAQESDALAELSESFAAAKVLMEDGQVAAFMAAPALSDDERLAFLQGLFAQAVGEGSVFAGGSQHGTNFIKLLLENGRVAVLPEIADHFETRCRRSRTTLKRSRQRLRTRLMQSLRQRRRSAKSSSRRWLPR